VAQQCLRNMARKKEQDLPDWNKPSCLAAVEKILAKFPGASLFDFYNGQMNDTHKTQEGVDLRKMDHIKGLRENPPPLWRDVDPWDGLNPEEGNLVHLGKEEGRQLQETLQEATSASPSSSRALGQCSSVSI